MEESNTLVTSNDYSDDEDEELDPRIKLELEKLNAATDGINHLETEFGEAQALFQQMMLDATVQLKQLHQTLGKCVEKSRPYFEALVQAKLSQSQLHEAALAFEQAQTRHFNAKKLVQEAERKAFSSDNRKLDAALQEYLNQGTIEVMEAAKTSQTAWEKHRAASVVFEQKQNHMNDLWKSLNKNIKKARPYFDLKHTLNKQLEFQKRRLEKIQEGLHVSKKAYSDTLSNLELISDDIHRSRELKRKALLEPRGEGVGADSDEENKPHDQTLKRMNALSLDNISDSFSCDDTESLTSEVSIQDMISPDLSNDNLDILNNNLQSSKDTKYDRQNTDMVVMKNTDQTFGSSKTQHKVVNKDLRLDIIKRSNLKSQTYHASNEDIKKVIEQRVSNGDEPYEVITSHSIIQSPPPVDILKYNDCLDGGIKRQALKHTKSLSDLTRDFDYFEKGELKFHLQLNRRSSFF